MPDIERDALEPTGLPGHANSDSLRTGQCLSWSLRALGALLGLAILVYPALPAGWFEATDPASGQPVIFNQSHSLRTTLKLLWALDGFRRIPVAVRAVGFAALAMLLFTPLLRSKPAAHSWSLPPLRRLAGSRWLPVFVGVVATSVLWVMRVSYAQNARFADAPILPDEVETGMVFAAEVLAYQLFHAVLIVLRVFADHPSGVDAISLTSCAAGGVFVAAMVVLGRTIGRTTGERIALFCGATLAGYVAMFFGYVETTQVELAAMGLYFGAAARALCSTTPRERTESLALALMGLTLALMAHAAGILLIPSAAVLLVAETARPGGTWRQAIRNAVSWRNTVLVGGLVVLPYVLVIVIPFYARGEVGNMTGGGDWIMFVPWQVDPAHPPSRYVYYSMLSAWHLADLGSAVLVAAPLALPLGLSAALLTRRRQTNDRPGEGAWLAVVATAAGFSLVVPVLWNHDFGMQGDWNLAACYLFPANLACWCAFIRVTRPWRENAMGGWKLLTPLVVVQGVLGLGLLLQLW